MENSTIKKPYKFLCSNGKCLTELKFNMTKEEFERRFYFSKEITCPICGFGIMYEVKQ